MKLYRTTDRQGNIRWSGSQAESSADRTRLKAEAGETARDFATTETVEVPTSKADLLAWLNARNV